MGIDVFGTEGEKTEENPCRVLGPNQKLGQTSSNQAVASHTKTEKTSIGRRTTRPMTHWTYKP